ncbi:MAG TPA: HDOD domain-containing protein [Gammaproteobacteria bacterium]|nr:HDOD domain-containing protein [Gammaproteobacteria bacterium]
MTTINEALLRKYKPFGQLDSQLLRFFVKEAKVRTLLAGEYMLKVGDATGDSYYLLQGEVEMKAGDGRRRRMQSGVAAAENPLAKIRPCQYSVCAVTTVEYMVLPPISVASTSEAEGAMGMEVDEVPSGAVGQDSSVLEAIFDDLKRNSLALPSLPEVALRVQRSIEAQESAEKIARIIEADPVVSAKLMRASNSVIFRGVSKISSVAMVVARLGLQRTRQLVLTFAMDNLFRSDVPSLLKRMQRLWSSSTQIAAVAHVLVTHYGIRVDKDSATLAGLICQIGVVPLLDRASKMPKFTNMTESQIESMLHRNQGQVGTLVLKKWDFPVDLAVVPETSSDWLRDHEGPPDLVDVILVSRLHCMGQDTYPVDAPPLGEVPALRRIAGEDAGPEFSIGLIQQAGKEINELTNLLNS